MTNRITSVIAFLVIPALGSAAAWAQQPTDVHVVIAEGDVPAGGNKQVVSLLNAPFTDAANRVGFVGGFQSGERFIWYDDGIVFLSSDAMPDVLTGGEGTMGISNAGDFIYSPSANGNDAVWTNNGALLVEGDAAPGFDGMFISFNSRPTMIDDATAHWVAGITNEAGGSTQARALYRSADAGTGDIEVVLMGGMAVDGFTIDDEGIGFDYAFSRNGAHHIQFLETTEVSNSDIVYVDGSVVVQQGTSTGDGDNWSDFDLVSINDNGDYVFSGATDGASSSNEFIAHNGSIVLREGETLDGVLLESGSSVRAVNINNNGKLVHIWGSGFGSSALEYLFVGDAADPSNSRLVLARNDTVDFDRDGEADATVDDFNASGVIGPGLELADASTVYVEVDLINIGETEEYEAIIEVRLFPVGDLNQDFMVGVADLLELLGAWGDCPEPCPPSCPADLDGNCAVGVSDLLTLLSNWG